MLLIISMRDLKPEGRDKSPMFDNITLADANEQVQAVAMHCATIILKHSDGSDIVLKDRW